MHFSVALCFSISCSRNKNVLLWSILWRTWTWDCQRWGVYVFLQSSHWRFVTTNSTTNVYWSKVPPITSFCTVILTFSLLEWGSVQMKPASIILTLFSPLTCLRHILRSWGDSNSIRTQGGRWYLLQSLQWWICTVFEMPSVMSTWDFKH